MDIKVTYLLWTRVGDTKVADKYQKTAIITVSNDIDPKSEEGIEEINQVLARKIQYPSSDFKVLLTDKI